MEYFILKQGGKMKTAEQILDEWLKDYPWKFWSKKNAIKAMEEYAQQEVRGRSEYIVCDFCNTKYHNSRVFNICDNCKQSIL